MDLGINGKNALVLASSQGLGLGIAEKLCAEGANVMLCGRSGDKLAEAAERLDTGAGGSAAYTLIDLADEASASALHDATVERFGPVDILVNNGGGPPPGAVSADDADAWRRQFDTMVLRLMQMTDLCLPAMREKQWGRVLTVASSGVQQPIPNLGMSNTLRAALVGWNKSLSNQVAADGITLNVLAPGRIHTSRVDQIDEGAAARLGKSVDEVRAAARAAIPVGRYGTVEEFASVAAFLVSAPASYVTGSVVRCDGGYIKGV